MIKSLKNRLRIRQRLIPRRNIFLICILAALLMLGITVYLLNSKNDTSQSVDCGPIISEADRAMESLDNNKAMDILTKNLDDCFSSTDKAVVVDYSARLAAVEFELGNKDQAKIHAERALAKYEQLETEDRLRLQATSTLPAHMSDIKNGKYLGIGGLN